MTAGMRGGKTSKNVDKHVDTNTRAGRKAVEAFVPWKKATTSEREEGNNNLLPSVTVGRGKEKTMSMPLKKGNTHSSDGGVCRPLSTVDDGGIRTARSATREEQQTGGSAKALHIHGQRNTLRPQGCAVLNFSVGSRPVLHAKKEVSTAMGSSSKIVPTTTVRDVQEEIFTRNTRRRFSVLQGVQGKKEGQSTETQARSGSTSPQADYTPHPVHVESHKKQEGRGNSRTPSRVEDEEKTFGDHGDELQDNGVRSCHRQLQSPLHALGLFNDGVNKNIVTDNEDDVDTPVQAEQQSADAADANRVFTDDLLYPSEAKRKKERRQEKAMLEKQGDIRRKESRPRNFLLVDEITKKPYSVGVGEWKKELMLLSRDLDPAIGNINKQPEGAVAEIVDWIQQTWEYSSPIKFEYVKEVIARGVTLRRADLWKKIRNGETKPTGMSDRTWRMLERQLENPASIRKSEDCRRANASRVNFGRTGPSGEVGVRQRLRRILRRSADPEEVSFEMARDKGFGGRRGQVESNVNVMLGSGRRRLLTIDVAHMRVQSGNSKEDRLMENEDNDPEANESEEENIEEHAGRGSREMVVRGTVSSMSTEEISMHPFVLMMMQRLEALEGRQAGAQVGEHQKVTEDMIGARQRIEGRRGEEEDHLLQDAGRAEESNGIEDTSTSIKIEKNGK